MKEIIELLLDLRIIPRVTYFDEERNKNQVIAIPQISVFDSLKSKIHAISINCDGSEISALSFQGASEDFINQFYRKCGVENDHKWVVSKAEDVIIFYFRVTAIPKNFGSVHFGLDLNPKQSNLFDKLTLITRSIAFFTLNDNNGKKYSFKNGSAKNVKCKNRSYY